MLTDSERAYFDKQVALSGLSKSKFLRALIEDVEIKARLPTEEYKKIYQAIAGLTNNVNQIARNANSNMYLTQSQLDEAIFLTKKCWQHIKDLR